jgi:anti-anti-sigma factor
MGADLKITSEQVQQGNKNIAVLHLRGWLDALGEKQLVETVQKAKDQGVEFILLEMSELDVITSAGIRAMQKAFQILTPKEEAYKVAHLKLASAPPQVHHVLGLTGFLQNVPMYESAQDALLSFEA